MKGPTLCIQYCVPQNFSLPPFVAARESCVLSPQDSTLLQKLLRYRSSSPIQLHECTKENIEIPLIVTKGLGASLPVSFSTVITIWDRRPPAIKSIRIRAPFQTMDAALAAQEDIQFGKRFQRFPNLCVHIQQECRKRQAEREAPCTCQLKSIYNEIAFYSARENCPRHAEGVRQAKACAGVTPPLIASEDKALYPSQLAS